MRRLTTPSKFRVQTRILSKTQFDGVIERDANNWRDTDAGHQGTGVYFHPITTLTREPTFCFFHRRVA